MSYVLELVKVYEMAIQHNKVSDASVFVNIEGVTDDDLRNKIKKTIRQNKNSVKQFLLSEDVELQLEFEQKRVTRKRSG